MGESQRMSGPLLEFKKAGIGYGRKAVLTDVDLEIEDGSFWGVFGYNGSGKTTLLKTLLGLIPVLKGKFTARGSSFGAPRFGYVPQKEKLDPIYPLTSCDVVEMGTYRKLELFRGVGGTRNRDLVAKSLHDCGAAGLAQRRYSDLSGGQKQRVLIARALAAEPELLVLDEPLAGIDVATQRSLLVLLELLKRDRKLTVLLVSHRLQAERSLFTHIAWVDDGRVECGPAEKLLKGKIGDVFRGEP